MTGENKCRAHVRVRISAFLCRFMVCLTRLLVFAVTTTGENRYRARTDIYRVLDLCVDPSHVRVGHMRFLMCG